MDVTVLFFSYAADRMKARERKFHLAPQTSIRKLYQDELQGTLGEPLEAFMYSVNAEWATPDTVLNAGDEVAVIPPVSGG